MLAIPWLTAMALGDMRVFSAACAEARSKFDSNRFMSMEDPETDQKIAEAWEVARLLRQNVVQGKPLVGEEERYRM